MPEEYVNNTKTHCFHQSGSLKCFSNVQSHEWLVKLLCERWTCKAADQRWTGELEDQSSCFICWHLCLCLLRTSLIPSLRTVSNMQTASTGSGRGRTTWPCSPTVKFLCRREKSSWLQRLRWRPNYNPRQLHLCLSWWTWSAAEWCFGGLTNRVPIPPKRWFNRAENAAGSCSCQYAGNVKSCKAAFCFSDIV